MLCVRKTDFCARLPMSVSTFFVSSLTLAGPRYFVAPSRYVKLENVRKTFIRLWQ